MKSRELNEELYKLWFGTAESVRKVIEDNIPLETETVLHLHYRYQKSLKDISLIIGKSISIVYNHHNRGLYLLKKILRQQESPNNQ